MLSNRPCDSIHGVEMVYLVSQVITWSKKDSDMPCTATAISPQVLRIADLWSVNQGLAALPKGMDKRKVIICACQLDGQNRQQSSVKIGVVAGVQRHREFTSATTLQ
jgi:hypothetical protein